MFGVSSENAARIKRQNSKKISVIIGNPPYNANQQNENDNNKNRAYPVVDKRIKETYIKYSSAQKTKMYDMYSRFLRWACDRVDENGIVAFVTNNSFIKKGTFDGFRITVEKEFSELWIVDLKGDAHTSGEIRKKEGGNVFNDQIRVGVAIYFLVKKPQPQSFKLYYTAVADYVRGEEKKEYLRGRELSDITFQERIPTRPGVWFGNEEFEGLLPLMSKAVKASGGAGALFRLFSWGNSSNRDEWVYDFDRTVEVGKSKHMVDTWNQLLAESNSKYPGSIKWSQDLKTKFQKGKKAAHDSTLVKQAMWRPFQERRLRA
jgi:predicted helicase